MFPVTLKVQRDSQLTPAIIARLIEYYKENKVSLCQLDILINSLYTNNSLWYVATEYPSVVCLEKPVYECFKIEFISNDEAHISILPKCETYDVKLLFQKDYVVSFEFSASSESKARLISEMFDYASVKDFMRRYKFTKEDIYKVSFK